MNSEEIPKDLVIDNSGEEIKIISIPCNFEYKVGDLFRFKDNCEQFVCEPVVEERENFRLCSPTDPVDCKTNVTKGEPAICVVYMPEEVNNEYTVMMLPKQGGKLICTWPILMNHTLEHVPTLTTKHLCDSFGLSWSKVNNQNLNSDVFEAVIPKTHYKLVVHARFNRGGIDPQTGTRFTALPDVSFTLEDNTPERIEKYKKAYDAHKEYYDSLVNLNKVTLTKTKLDVPYPKPLSYELARGVFWDEVIREGIDKVNDLLEKEGIKI